MNMANTIELLYVGAVPPPGWRAAICEVGFELRWLADAVALGEALRGPFREVRGVLLDLRDMEDLDAIRMLSREVARPEVRSLCLRREQDVVPQVMFELSLRYCSDTLIAPVSMDVLRQALSALHRRLALLRQASAPRDSDVGAVGRVAGLLGSSAPMRRLFDQVRKVAASGAPVLITGETGVGKELVASTIHGLSARSNGPFVAINCGAIPQHLLQSELFGYEKGAFTGATQRKIGRIESANGGTLLLDEIGDLPVDAQVGLLRFLQEGQIERIGGHGPIAVDVRVLSATHVDLLKAQGSGRFRVDLYHRLCIVHIDVPPLRDRGDDVVQLAQAALQRYAADARLPVGGFTDEALRALLVYDWPGNVRELVNRVRRAVVMSEGGRIDAADLGLEADGGRGRLRGSLELVRGRAAGDAIGAALARNRYVVARAARELGISRATLYRMMERYNVAVSGEELPREGVSGSCEESVSSVAGAGGGQPQQTR